jgi:gas vesicle protein
MTRTNSILLAALGGAALAALIANYLSTEKGRQLLSTASDTLQDLKMKATEYAKNNLGDIVSETTKNIGSTVKDTLVQKMQNQPAGQQ